MIWTAKNSARTAAAARSSKDFMMIEQLWPGILIFSLLAFTFLFIGLACEMVRKERNL
jgi:hypothetical protein